MTRGTSGLFFYSTVYGRLEFDCGAGNDTTRTGIGTSTTDSTVGAFWETVCHHINMHICSIHQFLVPQSLLPLLLVNTRTDQESEQNRDCTNDRSWEIEVEVNLFGIMRVVRLHGVLYGNGHVESLQIDVPFVVAGSLHLPAIQLCGTSVGISFQVVSESLLELAISVQ